MNDCDYVVIFGGSGFVGKHFTNYLLKEYAPRKIILADMNPPESYLPDRVQKALNDGSVEWMDVDVRKPIQPQGIPDREYDLICNFAAVHREAGNQKEDYFETNLMGAEHVTEWAQRGNGSKLVFTSSIAPYGPSETVKDEESTPMPETPYGISKLVAEKIHEKWSALSPENQLLILRPGVIFGPGEGGNVTRLVKGVIGGYFVYLGNRNTRKAGGYVKNLCELIDYGLSTLEESDENSVLANFTFDPPPSIGDYVEAVKEIEDIDRWIPSLPKMLPVTASYVLDFLLKPFTESHPFKPSRVRKSLRSNNIRSTFLSKNNFEYSYGLQEAMRDWKEENPEDW